MDDNKLPATGSGSTLQAPHTGEGGTPGFVPMKLVLQPNGVTVELTRPDMLLGRHSTADLRLPLPDVSRKHCRFSFADGTWQVSDLNSLNGVYVNDERVGQAVLRHHDMVRIGGFLFQVDLHSGEATVAIPADEQERVIKSIADLLPPPPGPVPEHLSRKAS